MKRHLITAFKLSLAILCLLVSYTLFRVLFDPITTTYNVTANTERMDIKTLDDNGSRLNLYDVDIYDTGKDPIFKKFNGQLKLNKGTSVTIQRVAFGSATIIFEAEGETVGVLFDTGNSFIRRTGQHLEISISSLDLRANRGETIVLPVDGEVSLGRSVDFEIWGESSPVLRSGQIKMTGTSTFSENFDAGTTQLDLGDQIVFTGQSSKAIGFVTLNEEPGMQVAYRVTAEQATILKSGPKALKSDPKDQSSGLVIQATVVDQLLKASSFQRISLFFGAVGAFLAFIISIKEISAFFKSQLHN